MKGQSVKNLKTDVKLILQLYSDPKQSNKKGSDKTFVLGQVRF